MNEQKTDFEGIGEDSTPGLSIIVCCYNSAERLPETLRHLAFLELDRGIALEVLVIDNCSTDNTGSEAKQIWQAFGQPRTLRVIHEPKPGLTHARKAGILGAQYDTLIFCDDDNWLCPTYAQTAFAIMTTHQHIAIAGGRSEAVFDNPGAVPAWFGKIKGSMAVGGSEWIGELGKDAMVWGAGMVVRRSALIRLFQSGFNFICSGRNGASLSAGDDAELCFAMQWLGWGIYYDGRLMFQHWIPEGRLTWSYLIRLNKGFGAATILNEAVRVYQHRNETCKNFIRTSFFYQVLRGGMNLLPCLFQLFRMENSDGDLKVLRTAGILGRFQAILALNLNYSKEIKNYGRWLASVDEHRKTTKCCPLRSACETKL